MTEKIFSMIIKMDYGSALGNVKLLRESKRNAVEVLKIKRIIKIGLGQKEEF